MRTIVRTSVALAITGLVLVVSAPAAAAQADEEPDNIVVLTGRAVVREGETVDNVVIADGPAVVNGTVRDALIALNGDVLIRGTAEEDVVAVDGRVVIADGGRVEGDVLSRHEPRVREGGQFDGSWERWDPRAWSDAASIVGWLGLWLAVSVSTLVLGLALLLLAPRAAVAVGEAVGAIGPVILWGLALLIGLPIVAVIAMATLVGFPLGLGLMLALGLIYAVGYTTGAYLLGRRVARGVAPPLAFLAGWGILRAVALVPVLGGLAWLAATVVGLGALAVGGYRTRRPAAADEPRAEPAETAPPRGASPPPAP